MFLGLYWAKSFISQSAIDIQCWLTHRNKDKTQLFHSVKHAYLHSQSVKLVWANTKILLKIWHILFILYLYRTGQTFSIVPKKCATGQYSLAHELAHNFGCTHDRFINTDFYFTTFTQYISIFSISQKFSCTGSKMSNFILIRVILYISLLYLQLISKVFLRRN